MQKTKVYSDGSATSGASQKNPQSLSDDFRQSMRSMAASVSIVTSCDASGCPHGMAVTSAVSLSTDPASMTVAVNKSASIHPIIAETGFFAINILKEEQAGLLEAFSRSDMRDRRFLDDQWMQGPQGVPVLKGSLSTHICRVVAAPEFGTHTVYFGQVEEVVLPEISEQAPVPIVWLNGCRVTTVGAGQK